MFSSITERLRAQIGGSGSSNTVNWTKFYIIIICFLSIVYVVFFLISCRVQAAHLCLLHMDTQHSNP